MQYQHVLAVDADDGSPALERATVWRGLMRRVEEPQLFIPGLQACRIVARSEQHLVRELDGGTFLIEDEVFLSPMQSLRFEARTQDGGRGSLCIEIIGDAGALALRFQYKNERNASAGGDQDGAALPELVRQAWHAADMDTVRLIRELAGRDSKSQPL